jgi:nitric oxide reductase NorD protein
MAQQKAHDSNGFPEELLVEYLAITKPIVALVGDDGLDKIAESCLLMVKGDWSAFMAWIRRCPDLTERLFNKGGKLWVEKAFTHVSLLSTHHSTPAAYYLVRSPEIFERVGDPGLDLLALFLSNISKYSWQSASRLVEKTTSICQQLVSITNQSVLHQILRLAVQITHRNWDNASAIFEQSPEYIKKLAELILPYQIIELLQLVETIALNSSVAAKKLLMISPQIIKRIEFDGLLSIAGDAVSMAKASSDTTVHILDKSPDTIDELSILVEKPQILEVFRNAGQLFAIHYNVGKSLLFNSPKLIEAIGFESIEKITDLCRFIGDTGWQTSAGIIEVAPDLVEKVGYVGLRKVADLSLQISQACHRTAAGFSKQSGKMLEKVSFDGLEEFASFCVSLAQDGSSIAVAFLERNLDLVDRLLETIDAESIIGVYGLANESAAENPIIALKVLEQSPEIISRIGMEGLVNISELSLSIAKESWTTADSLVKVLPDLIDRIGHDNVPKIASICLSIAKENVYGTINLIEKCPDIIDELTELISREAVMEIWELVDKMSQVTWRAGVVFFEQNPKLIERLGKSGTIKLAELSCRIAEKNPGLAIGLIEIGPELVRQIDTDGLDLICDYCLITSVHNPESSISFLRNSPYLMERLLTLGDQPSVLRTLTLAIWLARVSWEVSFELLKKSPDYVELAGFEGLELIADRAISLAKTNAENAISFVKGESIDFADLMDDLPKGLELVKVKTVLSKYLMALLGYPLEIEEGKSISTDGERIFLPKKCREFTDDDDNFIFYKVSATHLEGHLEFGSYDFDIDSVEDSVAILNQRYQKKAESLGSDLERYYYLFPEPELIMDFISLFEDFRIESILRREYPVLGEQIQRINEHLVAKRPPIDNLKNQKELLVDTISRYLTTGQQFYGLAPEVMRCLEFAVTAVQVLIDKTASIKNSVLVATDLYLTVESVIFDPYRPEHPVTKPIEQAKVNENIGSFGKVSRDISEQMQTGGPRPGSEPESSEDASSESTGESSQAEHQPQTDIVPQTSQRPAEAGRTFDEADSGGKFGAEDSRSQSHENEAASSAMKFSNVSRVENLLKALFKEKGITPKEVENKTKNMRPAQIEMYLQNLESLIQTKSELEKEKGTHLYPEWDQDSGGYSKNWTRIREQKSPAVSLDFYQNTLQKHSGLLKKVRREFQLLRPEEMAKLRKQYDGDEIDLDAAVEYLIDRKIGLSPSEKNYQRPHKIKRDIAVAILIDMSRSTKGHTIQCEKEALIILSEALKEVGDAFAVYGFSGDNRDNVDYFRIKNFEEAYGAAVKSKISAIDCRFENRDGTAIRHTLSLLKKREERTKLIILLSDGKPVDKEYSGHYAIEDTRMALLEAQKAGAETFCITVDKNAADYLPRMYSHSSWVVIDDVNKLPEKMSRIYGRLTR